MSTIWQTFRGGPAKVLRGGVGASIDKRGRICLSREAVKLIGAPTHVLMHYDERNGVIGISPSAAGEAGALPLKPRPAGCGSIIQAQPFCRHFRIKVDGTERFDEPRTDEHGILRLDLKATRRVAQKRSAIDVALSVPRAAATGAVSSDVAGGDECNSGGWNPTKASDQNSRP